MKENLVNLLMEEYKQYVLFEELEEKGIVLFEIAINNVEIVFDIIGFPKENSKDYKQSEILESEIHKKDIDENYFSREWLFQEHMDVVASIEIKHKIEVTDKGLQLVKEGDELLARKKLSAFVDWLYKEYANLK